MDSFTDYTAGGSSSASVSGGAATSGKDGYWELGKLKRAFTDYLGSKSQEIEEQKDARRYYHASQWTAEQIKVLKKRQQPATVFNRFGRKIDGVVGLLEKLRQDPKAFPRTPQHEEGAELATASVRYVLDEQRWKEKSPEIARDGAIDGIGGIEIIIEAGDQGDPEIGFEIVEPDSFVYDAQSYRADFSDAGYMGIAKWLDLDVAKEMFPDHADDLENADMSELSTGADREKRWYSSAGVKSKVRVVDLWYKHKGKWCWCIFTGATKLMEGESYLTDEKKKTICKYIMFSGGVDQDGDRYGFHRNMKSAQDAINTRQSKMQHILASKRLIVRNGAAQDIEVIRREWAKPDGVVIVNGDVPDSIKADDQSFDFAGWSKMMEMAVNEIEHWGPNPELLGQGGEHQSGRAIKLMQDAGIAQLGPYILAFKGFKLRVYRAIWNAIKQHWTAERWIRVTDDEGLKQFVQVNGMGVDPNTGMPAIINQLGALDVDIIMDESGDQVNMMADLFDSLQQIIPSIAAIAPPPVMMALVNSLIQASPLDASAKKQVREAQQAAANAPPPPDPMQAKMQEVQANAQIKAAELQQQGQIESAKLQQQNELKSKEMAQNAYFKQQELEQEAVFEQQKLDRDAAVRRQKSDNDMSMAVNKHNHDIQIMREKHDLDKTLSLDKMNSETEAKTKGSEAQAAPLKKVAGDLIGALTEIADSIKESIEAPKKITVQRDKTGKVVGAESAMV